MAAATDMSKEAATFLRKAFRGVVMMYAIVGFKIIIGLL
jgi:hypothetical protein